MAGDSGVRWQSEADALMLCLPRFSVTNDMNISLVTVWLPKAFALKRKSMRREVVDIDDYGDWQRLGRSHKKEQVQRQSAAYHWLSESQSVLLL